MPRYSRLIFPTDGLSLRTCKSRDPYRVRVFKFSDYQDTYYHYGTCFYKAAHQIAGYLIETDKPDISELDTFFFPLAFLYRHSMELLMKAIGFQYICDMEKRKEFIKGSFHNLSKIFQEIEACSDHNRNVNEMAWMNAYFDSLSKMDRESDSFRYPFHIVVEDDFFESSYSIKRVFENQTHIDLVKFANKFEACFEILDLWYHKDVTEAQEWKQLSPVFIERGGEYYGQSVVGYSFRREDFYPYTHAYTEAAGYLRDYMKSLFEKKEYDNANFFFLPMCYLYRNCVELSQKTIWFEETGEDIQERCKIMMDYKHSLAGMWKPIEKYILECGDGDEADEEYIELLKKYTFQLHDYDSDANRFRYPTNKELEPYFKDNKWFDFMRVADYFEAIINAYDGIDSVLNVKNEYEAEMQAEYYSYIDNDGW